ncbi:photosystem II stability/assembly factor-like uncharacterized protein [Variovorax paradoxus]|uniref:hypothetical protein n=1 Tax=Variovorax paradoxus TaxID=34073 RepID=UPI003392AE71
MRFVIGLVALGIHWAACASMPTWRGVEIRQFGQSAAQPERVYALGNGILFRSDDRGRTWSPLRMPRLSQATELHVDPNDAQHVLVLGRSQNNRENPELHESFDGGLHWVRRATLKFSDPNGLPGGSFLPTRLAIPTSRQPGDWWAYDGRWFRSSDSGQTWTRLPGGRLAFAAMRGPSVSFSLDDNVLWRSKSADLSWENVHEFKKNAATPSYRVRPPSNLIVLSDEELVVRDSEGNWLQSIDGGANWLPATNGFQSLNGPHPGSASQGPAARSLGETWCSVQRSPAAANTLLAQCIWDNGSFPISTCLHVSTDTGRSWMPPRTSGSTSGPDCQAQGLRRGWAPTAVLLDAVDPFHMLAAWQAGGLYRSDDGGKTWQSSAVGLMFRNEQASEINWAAIGEPALIQAVLYRDSNLLSRTLASGVDIDAPGNRLANVLDADLTARELESREQATPNPMMWPELRKARAEAFAVPTVRKGLLTRALELKLDDIADDLIRRGYDWGIITADAAPSDMPDSELREILHHSRHLPSGSDRIGRLIANYIAATRFPSADRTTLDLLDAGETELAIRVLKASTRRSPFDRQSTISKTSRRLVAEGLLTAGEKSWARRVFATVPRLQQGRGK